MIVNHEVRNNRPEALMRLAKRMIAATLAWATISVGMLAAAEETATPARGSSTKASTGQKAPAPPPSITVIGASDARGILGREVKSAGDENMGRIVDVIVARDGTVRAAVIDFGGFLGVGSRKVVVEWNALHFGEITNKKESITLELTLEQVKAAPEYKEGSPIVVLGASGSLQPLQYEH